MYREKPINFTSIFFGKIIEILAGVRECDIGLLVFLRQRYVFLVVLNYSWFELIFFKKVMVLNSC